ncbi:MAG: VOC family protein [Parasphingorhabdus sp.]|nr:VOC family protein [Parasphingorhabdus sp.]
MIGYTMLGTNDMAKATAFYDSLFEGTGVKQLFKSPPGGQFYGKSPKEPMIAITPPYDGGQANVGNGTMVALTFDDTAMVDQIHARALANGGSDEGAPGWRMENVFYGAYFRDPDGNKICACKMNFGG